MAPLSLRLRLPLDISLAVLVTGLVLAGTVLWHDYRALRRDLDDSTTRLVETVARALEPILRVGDRWNAWLLLRALDDHPELSWLTPTDVLVLDGAGRTLVASDPVRFPMALMPMLGFDAATAGAGLDTHAVRTWVADGSVWRVRRLGSAEQPLGTLILAFSQQRVWARFWGAFTRVLLATGAVLVLLLPVGWWLGWRAAAPLAELERCVMRLGEGDPPLACPSGSGGDELDRLRGRIEQVAAELRAKRELAAQMVRAERQAALGRLAAGVAHEINNPLAGMVTAIATWRRHPDTAAETLDLLERGLRQIHHVVSALLVEVRPKPRALEPCDVDDIAELIAPQSRERGLSLNWDNQLTRALPLPADTVRQILLNLVLNAVAAAPRGGRVAVSACAADGGLHLTVDNTGPAIPLARQAHLFEPFGESTSGGSGLGLWITDQAVRQLNGQLRLRSEDALTRFEVILPCEEPA